MADLIIETGEGVPGADSYATVADLQTRAWSYGSVLPPDTHAQEVLLRRAAEAMNALPWQGKRATRGQPLAWPRRDVPGVGHDVIPMAVKQAQCQLAIEIHRDDLDPPEGRRGPVVREKVDVLEVQYAIPPRPLVAIRMSLVVLRPYLRSGAPMAVRA